MSAKYPSSQFPQLKWMYCDVREGGLLKAFPEESFEVVLDKAFLDAFLARDTTPPGSNCKPEEPFDIQQEANDLMNSIFQLLKPGGVYILISLLQGYILKLLVGLFDCSVYDMIVSSLMPR